MRQPLALLLLAAVAGCKSAPPQPQDPALTSQMPDKADVDPAVARALEDPILVDPNLVGQSNQGAILPHNPPDTGAVPVDPSVPKAAGERPDGPDLGDRPAAHPRGCAQGLAYGLSWSNRLPTDVPLPSGSQVEEAAGMETPHCHIRAVTLTHAAPPDEMLDFYRTTLKAGGYNVSEQRSGREIWLKALGPEGRVAFLIVTPGKKQGSLIDLITNHGR